MLQPGGSCQRNSDLSTGESESASSEFAAFSSSLSCGLNCQPSRQHPQQEQMSARTLRSTLFLSTVPQDSSSTVVYTRIRLLNQTRPKKNHLQCIVPLGRSTRKSRARNTCGVPECLKNFLSKRSDLVSIFLFRFFFVFFFVCV